MTTPRQRLADRSDTLVRDQQNQLRTKGTNGTHY